jgi:hypothetical protein
MAYYINIIFCLGFLLGALLLTSRYLQDPSIFKLSAIGLLALLSMLSWNFTILAIWAIPLSAFCGKKGNSKRAFLSLTLVIAIAFGVFSLGYFHYAGIRSMGAHNPNILTSFLTIRYLEHWFLGSFVSPFCYVLWGRGLNVIESLLCSLSLLIPILIIIGVWGTDQEKRLGLWCFLVNALPFLLVSLARFQFPLFQALSHRYGVLTLLWGLLLIGKAWEILARHLPARPWFQVLLPLAILLVMICGQVSPTPRIREIYLGLAKRARVCYQSLPNKADNFSLQEANQPFCPELPPWINKKQGVIIKQFLTGS